MKKNLIQYIGSNQKECQDFIGEKYTNNLIESLHVDYKKYGILKVKLYDIILLTENNNLLVLNYEEFISNLDIYGFDLNKDKKLIDNLKLTNIFSIRKYLNNTYYSKYSNDDFLYKEKTEQEKLENPEWYLDKDFKVFYFENILSLENPEENFYFGSILFYKYKDGTIVKDAQFLFDESTTLDEFIKMFDNKEYHITKKQANELSKIKYKTK